MPRTLEHFRRLAFPARALALVALAQAAPRASAQVVTDGSLGAAGPVSRVNGTYSIPETLGRRHGSNLFHSFGRLDLAAGETATFSGAAAVTNVLARVTGGQPSSIDGALRCTIPGASFYLVNPAGVVFGPNASIDVSGSFAVTTADFVRLADGRQFEVAGASDALLTTAPPAAFGFLGSTRTAVAANGARLGVGNGQVLSLVGGDVRLAGARVDAPGGRVNLAAVASQGEVRLDPLGPGTGIDVLASQQGTVEVAGGSLVNVSADPAGSVFIRAGSLRLEDSQVVAATAAADGGGLDVVVTGPAEILRGGLLATNATAQGSGAAIRLSAGRILIDPQGSPSVTGLQSQTRGTGNGGEISVVAESLAVQGGGQVLSQAVGPGTGGTIRVDVQGRVLLDGPLTDGPYAPDSLFSSIRAEQLGGTSSAGGGGDVTLSARELRVLNLAFVSTTTNGGGAGGTARIMADRIVLDGARRDEFTGIGANTQAVGNAGSGGEIIIEAASLKILRGAGVAARTLAPGALGDVNAGSIDIAASRVLRIDGRRTPSDTGINSESTNSSGGDVAIRAGRFEMVRGKVGASAVVNRPGLNATGASIMIGAERLDMVGSEVSASATSTDPNTDPRAASVNGGTIDVQVTRSVRLTDSQMNAEAQRNGGTIRIDPVSVVLTRSRVNANAVFGNGGDITIVAGAFLRDPETEVTASSRFGLEGSVRTSAPQNDISRELVQLSASFASAAARLKEICGVQTGGGVSSFIVTGRGGAPPEPGGWQPDWEVDLAAPRSGNR